MPPSNFPPALYGEPDIKPIYVQKTPDDFRVTLIKLAAALFTALLVWGFTQVYYGDDAVRLVGIIAGVIFLIFLVFAVFMLLGRFYAGMVGEVSRNVISGIISFQAADDQGETARLAAIAQNRDHDGHQLAYHIVRQANRISDNQKPVTVSAEYDWDSVMSEAAAAAETEEQEIAQRNGRT